MSLKLRREFGEGGFVFGSNKHVGGIKETTFFEESMDSIKKKVIK